MSSATRGEARVHVAVPPARVYALVSDVTRMGEWSPETHHCHWLDGATGPAVGVRFQGSNHLGPLKWKTECTITAADPGREFAFSVIHPSGREETRWRYTFAPTSVSRMLPSPLEVVDRYPTPEGGRS